MWLKISSRGGEKKKKTWSLRCYSVWQAQSNPSHPRPGLRTNEPTQRGLYYSCFPSIRYTQGKQEGIRMGPDRHLVCWEISLSWSESLPSPLPAAVHQMWGEGHIASSLCWVVGVCSALPHTGQNTYSRSNPHAYFCAGIHTLTHKQNFSTKEPYKI